MGSNVHYRLDMTTKPPAASRTQHVYEQIRAQLLNGRLEPGRRLIIAELCQGLSANQSAYPDCCLRLAFITGWFALEPKSWDVASNRLCIGPNAVT